MAVLDKLRGAIDERDASKPPGDVWDRVTRGRARKEQGAAKRKECLAFFRGDHYCSVQGGKVTYQSTVTNTDGTGKPAHRVRQTRNLITPIIGHKVSAATSRVPGYEVNPSKIDLEAEGAARMAGKVARYGWDAWNVRQATVKAVTLALVADEGFAWPFFDNTIGPFTSDDSGKTVGQGDIRIRTFSGNEVYWEPGIDFMDSGWHGVEQARAIAEVKAMDGYDGPEDLAADAVETTADSNRSGKLVMVTDYLERPSKEHVNGRWITFANNQVIAGRDGDGWRSYPCEDHKGNVLDEPVLHKICFIVDPSSDRDMGLVRHLLDAQRTYEDCINKQVEWKNTALNPQAIVKNGKLVQKLTDVPGDVFEFWGSGDVSWRPVPAVPQELEEMKQAAKADMQYIAADQDVPTNVEAAKAISALLERDQSVWQDFYANLAEFHSRLMRHCLYLVQQYYTEPRLLQIRGHVGPETLKDFLGANLRGEADVTVLPGSIEPRTRAAMEQRVMAWAQLGWVSKEAAMAAINGGNAEALVESYELDVGRANRMVNKIKDGPQAYLAAPLGANGRPKWMPRKQDNIDVHLHIVGDYMKTEEYDASDDMTQEAFTLYYDGCEQLKAEEEAKKAAAEQAMASGLGMANAAAPQSGTTQPSIPGSGLDANATPGGDPSAPQGPPGA